MHSVSYDYDCDADAITVTITIFTDGGRTSDDHVETVPVNDADVDVLTDAIRDIDSSMLEELCDDDLEDAAELRTVFRSLFMPLQDAVAMGA
jgi:hypothetical protein